MKTIIFTIVSALTLTFASCGYNELEKGALVTLKTQQGKVVKIQTFKDDNESNGLAKVGDSVAYTLINGKVVNAVVVDVQK